MSNTEHRLPLVETRRIADELVELLTPVCERIEIAGSIRRQKADIGDVEIVAIPKTYEVHGQLTDMFGNVEMHTVTASRLEDRCAGLLRDGTFRPRLNKDGKSAIGWKLKWLVYRDFPIDLYICELETWGVTMAIRTGPAEFSHRLVTPRSQGGLCPSSLEFKGWRLRRRDTHEALDTPTEESLFEALGMLCPDPWLRTDTYQPVRLAHV